MSILRSVTSSRRWGTFLRYAAGSLVATGCSEVVLVSGYGLLGLGPQAAAVVAWVAGAVPNYLLNRRWAWSERDRSPVLRELLPYWVITLGTAALAIAATTAADGVVRRAVGDRGERSFLLGLVYLAAYGLVFVVKFVLFDNWVFSAKRSCGGAAAAVPAAESG